MLKDRLFRHLHLSRWEQEYKVGISIVGVKGLIRLFLLLGVLAVDLGGLDLHNMIIHHDYLVDCRIDER
jgi:hypothetical protein